MARFARLALASVTTGVLSLMITAPALASALTRADLAVGHVAGHTMAVTVDDPAVMRWLGTVVFTQTNPSTGVASEPAIWSEVTVEYLCDDATCDLAVTGGVSSDSTFSAENALFDLRDFSSIVLNDEGEFSRDFPAVGDPCNPDSPVLPISVATGTLTPDGASFSLTTEEWGADCPNGGRTTYFPSVRTFEGVYVSGDPCALTDVCGLEAVTIITPQPSPTPVAQADVVEEQAPAVVSHASRSQLASGAASAPSVLSGLIPIQDSQVGLIDLGVAIAVTVILSLLVAFPKKLFSSAVGAVPKRWTEYRDQLSVRDGAIATRWNATLARVDKANSSRKPRKPSREPEEASGPASHPVLSKQWRRAAVGVVLAGVISAFVDPGFGLNLGSLRVAASLGASFVLTVVIGWGVAIWIARRFTPGLTASYSFKPLSLVIVVLTVFFTRVTGMEPGMVFGLVAGVALGAMSSKATEARVAVAQTGYAFATGVVGWISYSALAPTLAGSDNVFAALFIDTLSGLSVAGFAAAPLALLPIAGMGGSAVFEWNRRVWLLMYSTGLLGFFVVLMPMSYSWREVDFSLKAWVGLYLVYAAAAVIAYMALVRPWQRAHAQPDAGESDDAALGTGIPETSAGDTASTTTKSTKTASVKSASTTAAATPSKKTASAKTASRGKAKASNIELGVEGVEGEVD